MYYYLDRCGKKTSCNGHLFNKKQTLGQALDKLNYHRKRFFFQKKRICP
jgi:hypothetical protein